MDPRDIINKKTTVSELKKSYAQDDIKPPDEAIKATSKKTCRPIGFCE